LFFTLIPVLALLSNYDQENCLINVGTEGSAELCPPPSETPECINCLRRRLEQTPLEILAGALLHFDHLDKTALKLVNAYDGFLGILADPDKRNRLEKLEPERYESDAVFQAARQLSHAYRDGLLELFFDDKSDLFRLTKNYGIF
jgi:hypothetical protein